MNEVFASFWLLAIVSIAAICMSAFASLLIFLAVGVAFNLLMGNAKHGIMANTVFVVIVGSSGIGMLNLALRSLWCIFSGDFF